MFSPPGAQQYQLPAQNGPQSAMMRQLQGRRAPQDQAWNASPYNVYSDGPGGSSNVQAGDSPNGALNLGGQLGHSGGDPRASLIQHIIQSLSQTGQGNRSTRPAMGQPWGQGQGQTPWQIDPGFMHPGDGAGAGFDPGAIAAGGNTMHDSGFGAGSHPVVDRFHMVDAAHNLAKQLAGRGAGTLRRYQGRH